MEELGKYYRTMKYIGKELKREGKGPKGEYKVFILKFDIGRQYPINVNCFDGMLKDKKLDEGKYYTVGYEVREFESQYGKKSNRNGFFIKEATEEDIKKGSDPQPQGQKKEEVKQPEVVVKEPKLPSPEELRLFEYDYQKTLKEPTDDDPHRFVLTWFLNKHNDEFVAVLTYAKNRA